MQLFVSSSNCDKILQINMKRTNVSSHLNRKPHPETQRPFSDFEAETQNKYRRTKGSRTINNGHTDKLLQELR